MKKSTFVILTLFVVAWMVSEPTINPVYAIAPMVGAALIGGGASLASSLVGSMSGRKAQRSANQMNLQLQREANLNRMELAKYGHRKDLEMWNLMNEYNSPSAQMARLKEAGLNPNLVYGSGTVAGNAAQGMPSFPVPSVGTPQVGTLPPLDIGAGEAVQSGIRAYSGSLGLEQQRLDIQGKEFENIAKEWTADIRNFERLSAQRKNEFESILHGEIKDEGHLNRLLDNWVAKMESQEKQNLSRDLQNRYQQKVNDMLINQGMRPGDSIYLRIGNMLLEALGISPMEIINKN